MTELQRHKRRLCRAHHQNGERHRHYRPQDSVQPERRRKAEFHPKGQCNDNGTEQQDHADDGAVTSVVGAKVETADLASVAHLQEIAKQRPRPAARTAAGQCDMQDRSSLLRHRASRQRPATTGLAPHQ